MKIWDSKASTASGTRNSTSVSAAASSIPAVGSTRCSWWALKAAAGSSPYGNFPLDGALIVGLGGQFVSGSSLGLISGGLSLGRRVDPKDTQVSIVPYAEPTFYISSGAGNTDTHFALGLGADFRLSKVFDARVSVGLGDVEGIAFSAVWVH